MGLLYRMLWLFFIYSFCGWAIETTFAVGKSHKFINKGFFNGPLCTVYGFAAVAISLGFNELQNNVIFLFLGCVIVTSVCEWITGKLLEYFYHQKWWDYSDKKWNIDGFVCLSRSIIWGILGCLGLKFLNPILIKLYDTISFEVKVPLLWVLVGIAVIDAIGSFCVVNKTKSRLPKVEEINSALTRVTVKLGNWISGKINKRIKLAYPSVDKEKAPKVKSVIFASGCGFYKLVVLFFIGGYLGDIVETIFCRITMGYWMSRSSVVCTQFSVVWGLAVVIATMLLYNLRDKSDGYIFVLGTIMGGAYEYLCSVFTEIVFGKVFWDYSDIPFNLGGRINLLFCFFWGITGVIWLKKLYPFISKWIEKIPIKLGVICSWALIIFMVVNMVISSSALSRYSEREFIKNPRNPYEQWLDKKYDDATMMKIYPKAVDKRKPITVQSE